MLYGCINENTRLRGSLGNSALGRSITGYESMQMEIFVLELNNRLQRSAQQNHNNHIFWRDQAVSHTKFSAENDYHD